VWIQFYVDVSGRGRFCCINGSSRAVKPTFFLAPLFEFEYMVPARDFHVANFDAKARSTAFSHQHIEGAWMTEVVH
jgi:hypothetical protein